MPNGSSPNSRQPPREKPRTAAGNAERRRIEGRVSRLLIRFAEARAESDGRTHVDDADFRFALRRALLGVKTVASAWSVLPDAGFVCAGAFASAGVGEIVDGGAGIGSALLAAGGVIGGLSGLLRYASPA